MPTLLRACDCKRPFAVYDHMVQKPPCWRANYPLGHPKQKNIKLSCFVLDVPVGSLLSSMAVFVPCDRKLQRAYSRWNTKGVRVVNRVAVQCYITQEHQHIHFDVYRNRA